MAVNNRNLHVTLDVKADVKQAQAQMKSLQNTLQEISRKAYINVDDSGLQKASTAAQELQQHLNNAFNVNTGKLDLNKFSASLASSKKNIADYKRDLEAIGTSGEQAFVKVAQSIAQADAPLLKANTRLNEFLGTLKNTARWQLSSSILHGFMGSIQQAYGYAQDLNQSLNNIQIVTGQSAQQMAQLAEKANKAAQALSTRTTDYTNAALIYYQQGLGDKEVEKRTETTLKLANVSRQSAEEVSTQMTAIWNNFADGSKELEYYADAITALGAKTASSSSEIAEGLSKFASIADTIGLSYETASASIATVIAETRQSADTVGNAFKSIFARIQSLKLGETLEDGVGLTKYTAALETVGVKVLDINGELREADDILNDLGQRWTEISDTQKTALAQTVAGQRQYAQFMALMGNWDKVQANVDIAAGSEGSLEEQQERYASGWEASSKRVRAALENIWNSLVDDKFFINLNDGLTKVLNGVSGLINGLGGLKGILLMVGSFITEKLVAQAPNALNRIKEDLFIITGQAEKLAQKNREDLIKGLQGTKNSDQSVEYDTQIAKVSTLLEMKNKLAKSEVVLTDVQKQSYSVLVDQVEKEYERQETLAKTIDEQRASLEEQKTALQQQAIDKKNNNFGHIIGSIQQSDGKFNILQDEADVDKFIDKMLRYNSVLANARSAQVDFIKFNATIGKDSSEGFDQAKQKVEEFLDALEQSGKVNKSNPEWQAFRQNVSAVDGDIKQLKTTMEEATKVDFKGLAMDTQQQGIAVRDLDVEYKSLKDQMSSIFGEDVIDQLVGTNEDIEKKILMLEKLSKAVEEYKKKGEGFLQPTGLQKFSSGLGLAAGQMMRFSSLINSVKSSLSTFGKEGVTTSEKVTAGIGLATSALFYLISTIKIASAAMKTFGGPIGIAVGVAVTAFGALAGAIGASEAAAKKHQETLKKNAELSKEDAEKSKEKYDATKEEIEKNQELLAAYEEAVKVYEDTGTGKSNIISTGNELLKAYGLESEAIRILNGDYRGLISTLQAVNNARLDESLAEGRDAVEKKKQSIYDQMKASDHYAQINSDTTGNQIQEILNHMNSGSGELLDYTGNLYSDLINGSTLAYQTVVENLPQMIEDGIIDLTEEQAKIVLGAIEETLKTENGKINMNALAGSDFIDKIDELQSYSDISESAYRFSDSGGNYWKSHQVGKTGFESILTKLGYDNVNIGGYQGENGGIEFQFDSEGYESTLEAYKEITSILAEIDALDKDSNEYKELKNNPAIKAMRTFVEEFESEFESLDELEQEVESLDIASIIKKANVQLGGAEIDSKEAYEGLVTGIVTELQGKGYFNPEDYEATTEQTAEEVAIDAAREAVDAALMSTGQYNNYAGGIVSTHAALKNASKEWDEDKLLDFQEFLEENGYEGSEDNPQELTTYYYLRWQQAEKGDEAANKLFESIEETRDLAQQQLDSKNYFIELDAQMSAVEGNKYKSGMTSSELKDFETSSGILWGETIKGVSEESEIQIKTFNDFLLMTEQQREEYLTQLYSDMAAAREAELKQSVTQSNELIDEIKKVQLPDAEKYAGEQSKHTKDFFDSATGYKDLFHTGDISGENYQEELDNLKTIIDTMEEGQVKFGYTKEELQKIYEEGTNSLKITEEAQQKVADLNAQMEGAEQTVIDANLEQQKTKILQKQEEKDLWKELDALDLKAGDILSSKQGKALKDAGLDDYIQELSDGTYRVKSNAEGLIDAIHESRIKIAQETTGESTTLTHGNKQYANEYWTDEDGKVLKDEKGNDLKKRYYSKQDQANIKALTDEGVDTSTFNTKELFETPEGFAAYMAALDQHNAKTQEAKAYVGDLVESFADLNALVANGEIEKGSEQWQDYVDYLKETESAASEAKSALDLVNAAGRKELGDRDEALKAYTAAGNTDKFRIGQMQSIYKNTMAEGEEFQFEDFAQWVGENAQYVEASAGSLDVWREKFEALGPEGIEVFNKIAGTVDLTGKSIKELEEMDGLPKSLRDQAIQNVRSNLLSTVETLEDLKNVSNELDGEGYLQGLKQLMSDDAIDSSQINEELENIVKGIQDGTYEADVAIPIYEELLDMSEDGTLTTLEKIERKIQDGIQLASNYSALIKELSGDKYTENEQLANQKATREQIKNDNTKDTELGRKLTNEEKADLITSSIQTDISRVKGAEGLTDEQQLDAIKDLHTEYNSMMKDLGQSPAPMVLRQLGSAAADIVKNIEGMTLSEQIQAIKDLFGTDPNNAVVASQAIMDLLGCKNNDTNEQMKQLLTALEQGIIDAKTLKEILTGITQDTSIAAQDRLNMLDAGQEDILDELYHDNWKEATSMGLRGEDREGYAQEVAAQQLTDQYQNIVDSLDTTSFETPEAFVEFFDMLPEGVDYMYKVDALFGSMAEKVTSFDQLDKFGELMTNNGANDDYFKENEDWQTAMENARTGEAKSIGVDVDEFRNYEEMIYNVISAENELGRSEQELQVLSMKMTKSMMDQEQGYEDLKSATKKYTQEISDFADGTDKTSMKANKAITELQKSCEKLFGGKVSKNFVEQNLEDIEKAAEGDIDALKRLQKQAAKDYASGLKLTTKELDKLNDAIEDQFAQMDDVQIGDDISDQFRNTLNEMLASGKITVEQAEEMLNHMGYNANFDGLTMAVSDAESIMADLGPAMQQGLEITDEMWNNALSKIDADTAAGLNEMVEGFRQAGMSSGEAYNTALNNTATQLEVHEKEVQMQDDAAAKSHSSVDLGGNITSTSSDSKGGDKESVTTEISGHMDIDTETTAVGDGDITLPTLGKGGASYNGGGAGAGSRSNAGSGGSGGSGGSCFIAGTLITMGNNFKNIENVEVGDIVLSYNEELRKNEYSKVIQTMTHIVNENIYTLYIEDEQIIATGIHPFLIMHNGIQSWTIASELKEGDLVLFADGTLHQISKIKIEVRLVPVYNLEVANNHNYYVGTHQVLAHNKGRGGGSGKRPSYGRERKASKLNANDEIDRYHKLNNQLENLEKQYDRINTVKDRLYGKARIAKIDEEIAKQDEIIAKEKEYLKAVEANIKIDEEALKKSNKNTVQKYNDQQAKVDKLDKQYQEALKKDPNGKKKKTKNIKKKLQNAQKKLNKIDTTGLASYDRADGTKGYISASAKDYLGMDVQIEDGVITNYEALRKADIAKYNAAMDEYNLGIDKYNSINQATDEGKKKAEEMKKQLDANKALAEAQHEQFLKLVQQYEDTQDLLEEKKKAVLDAQNQKMDLMLEKVEYTVEVKIDVHNDELEYLDFLMERLGDHVGNTAEKFGLLARKMNNLSSQNEIYRKGLEGILSNHTNAVDSDGVQIEKSGYLDGEQILQKLVSGDQSTFDMLAKRPDFTEAEISDMTEWVKGQLQNALSFRETKDQLFRELDEIFNKMTEKMDFLLEKQNHYQQQLEHYYNIINTVGRRTLGITDEIAARMDQARLTLQKTNVDMAKRELDSINHSIKETEAIRIHNQEKYEEALKSGQASLAKEYQHNLDIIDETLTNMYSKQMEAEENYWSQVEKAAEFATEKYANEVDRTIQRFSDIVAKGFRNIENLQTAFDRYVNTHKTYVEDYEKVYRLEKMTRDLQKDIDESNNVKIKEQYLKLQEEINKASEKGVKVSEYDLQLMERKREILEAQQQLEDAQKAKTQVSLTRDNEGNYGYVYTADPNDVAEAEQNYSDKIYEMRKLNAEYINELQQQLMQLNANMANDIQQLKDRLEINSDEYKAELNRIKKDYADQEADIYQQLQKAFSDSTEINTQYATTYAELTGDRLALEINYVDKWKETVMGQLMKGYATLEEYQQAWTTNYITLYGDVSAAAEQWQEDQAYVLDLSKDTLADYGEHVNDGVDNIENASATAADAMNEMAAQTEEYMSGAADAIHNLGDDYTTEAQRMMDEADELADKFIKLKAAWAGIKSETKVQTKEVDTSDKDKKKKDEKKGGRGGGTKKSSKNKNKNKNKNTTGASWSNVQAAYNLINSGVVGNGETRKSNLRARGFSDAVIQKAQSLINMVYPAYLGGYGMSWESAKRALGFKTGGYTGEWGPEGKLAVLHEKEIVLDKDDTKNLLDSMEILKQITSIIDINAIAASGALGNISAGSVGNTNNELDQHVEITANFPNATSREEIQAAFENLVGMASQYANRS